MKNHYYHYERSFIQLEIGNIVKGKRILDIGCGAGRLGKVLKEKWGASYVAGIELNVNAAKEAQANMDMIIQGNVEEMELPFEKNGFDIIIFGDLLEHLIEPWNLLRKSTELLKKGGVVCISIPNIRHIRVLYKLIIRGLWEYEDAGILDKTHLRFFTKKTLISMIEDSQLELIKCRPMLVHRLLSFLTFFYAKVLKNFVNGVVSRKTQNIKYNYLWAV